MIEQWARVQQLEAGAVLVKAEAQSGCSSCGAAGGCGTSLIASLFPNRVGTLFRVGLAEQAVQPAVGDRVLIGIDEHYLQQASLLMYALPLLTLIGGALLGAFLAGGASSSAAAELGSVLGGIGGLLFGLWMARTRALAREQSLQQSVKVLRVEPGPGGVAVAFSPPPASK